MRRARPCATSRLIVSVALLALAGSAVACGSSGNSVVHHPGTSPVPSASVPTSTPPTSTAPSSPAPTGSGGSPTLAVTPSTGLHDKQTVVVRGSGFTPGQPYTVIECAQKGNKTGPGDCNLPGMLTATADQDGVVKVQLQVLVGPFGGNKIVCSARQACLISVTQASLSPTEEADRSISFAR